MNIEPQRPGQLERPLEQRASRATVGRAERAPAGGGEMLTGPLGESRIGLSELGLVAGRLLQVVTEDLVQLDEVGASLFEPCREALVQLGSGRLGQRVVGGVSDQQVAEAEGVFRRNLRRVGADQALADEGGEARRHRPAVSKRLNSSAVEDLALDRTPLEHRALRTLELVEPCGEKRLQGRRDDQLALDLPRPSPPSRSRTAGFLPSRTDDPLAHVARQQLRDELVDICVR